MLKICLKKVHKHVQIEFPPDLPFPPGRRGGRETSLHLQRGTYRDVTEEELAWIQTSDPALFSCLQVSRVQPLAKRTARRLAAANPPKVAAKSKRKRSRKR